jgi:hypothetical protein
MLSKRTAPARARRWRGWHTYECQRLFFCSSLLPCEHLRIVYLQCPRLQSLSTLHSSMLQHLLMGCTILPISLTCPQSTTYPPLLGLLAHVQQLPLMACFSPLPTSQSAAQMLLVCLSGWWAVKAAHTHNFCDNINDSNETCTGKEKSIMH